MIEFRDWHGEKMKDPDYRAAWEALEPDFAFIRSAVQARTRSGLTQDEIARRMGTTQSAVARLESGRARPSTRTLLRYAEATGSRLRITFEPVEPATPQA